MDNGASISSRDRVASFSKIYLCPAFSSQHFLGIIVSDCNLFDRFVHFFLLCETKGPITSNRAKQKNDRLHIFRPLSFNPDAPDPGQTTPGLVPHHRSTCPFRFTRGLTPSYRIAGRYGRLILLSTKALGCVMRSTSTPFFTHTLPPSSPPHQVQITAFTSSTQDPLSSPKRYRAQ